MNRDALAELVMDPDRVDDLPEKDLPEVVAALEGLRARAWARLTRPSGNGTAVPEEAPREDNLLNVEEAADILGVEPRWLYDRSDSLPFARKLAPRTLRFSERGLYRWLETRP